MDVCMKDCLCPCLCGAAGAGWDSLPEVAKVTVVCLAALALLIIGILGKTGVISLPPVVYYSAMVLGSVVLSIPVVAGIALLIFMVYALIKCSNFKLK